MEGDNSHSHSDDDDSVTFICCKRMHCSRVFEDEADLKEHEDNCNDGDDDSSSSTGNQVFQMKKVSIPICPIELERPLPLPLPSTSSGHGSNLVVGNELSMKPSLQELYPDLKEVRVTIEHKDIEIAELTREYQKKTKKRKWENDKNSSTNTATKKAKRSCTTTPNKKRKVVKDSSDEDDEGDDDHDVSKNEALSEDSDLVDFGLSKGSSSSSTNCKICNKKCKNRKQMNRHIRTHDGETPFACPFKECPHRFARKEHVGPHLKESHYDSSETMNVCFCYFCDMAFNNSPELISHALASHTGKQSYPCKEEGCGEIFSRLADLRNHRVNSLHEELQNLPFNCPHCPKKFKSQHNANQHAKRVHKKDISFTCQFCGKTFPDTSAGKRHERTHTGERNLKCQYCGKIYNDPSNFKRHQKIHIKNQDFNYGCSNCGASFCTKTLLENHECDPNANAAGLGIVEEIPLEDLVNGDLVEVDPFGGDATPVAATAIIDPYVGLGVEEDFMHQLGVGDWAEEFLTTESLLMVEYDLEEVEENLDSFYDVEEFALDIQYHFLKAPITPSDDICIKPACFQDASPGMQMQKESKPDIVSVSENTRRYPARLRRQAII